MSDTMMPTGSETAIRAIVFKEADMYVAQCLEYDIAAQAPDLQSLFPRLELTVEAEFAMCEADGKPARECIVPAPTYYHDLWKAKSASITPTNVAVPGGLHFEYALAAAA